MKDSLAKLAILTLGAISWCWIGYWVSFTIREAKQAQTENSPLKQGIEIGEMYLVGGSSLKAVAPPAEIKIKSLGVMIDELLMCESSGQHYNKDGTIKRGKAGELGIAQFKIGTWEYFNKLRGTNLDIYSEKDQLDMLRWCLENDLGNNWTCYEK